MKHLKNNKGFTLIEIIVIVVILAVLMAIAAPSVLKYASEGDKTQALDDAYACVSAAKYYGVRSYVKGENLSEVKNDKIQKLAGVEGTIVDFSFNTSDNSVKALIYKSLKGIFVKFENDKYEFVDMNTSLDPSSAADIFKSCQELADLNSNIANAQNSISRDGKTQLLQKDYIEKYSGCISLSQYEKELLNKYEFSFDESKNLAWKPLYDAEGNIYLIADTKKVVGAGQGPMIFYKGHYYYFKHNYDQNEAATTWVQEGKFVLDEKLGFIE